ncbi:hypothetical protein [Halorientalis pallida]|uniref:Uncharacterized protein n=1 Tax=Halorientalis pallida TaxID=2479928 RepID=A0A498L9X8_9EURY|nr:hypothetical protein [Halorientalis pallida]RXK51993.1 hypothetical protein EAF64_05010 [Halorientalis pallida]
MYYFGRRPRLSLSVLGTTSILTEYLLSGELFHGYSLSVNAVLLHAGVFSLLLPGTMTLCVKTSLRSDLCGVVSALLTLAVLYPLAVGFIWYDLVVTLPPYNAGNPTLVGMARNRLTFVLGLAPITAGVISGAYVATPREKRSLAVPILACALVIGGPALGYWLAVQSGAHGGFAMLLFVLLALGAGLGSLPLAVFTKLEYDAFSDEQES